jgi:hypothetical protein
VALQQSGAVFDTKTEKLKFPRPPTSKADWQMRKRMKRYEWECRQKLVGRLNTEPLGVAAVHFNYAAVDYERLRPALYVLIKKALDMDKIGNAQSQSPNQNWLYSQQFGDTLIALLKLKQISAGEVERRLRGWGMHEVRSRLLTKFLWSLLITSAKSVDGVAPLIAKCERESFAKLPGSSDYVTALNMCDTYRRARKIETQTTTPNLTQCSNPQTAEVEERQPYQPQQRTKQQRIEKLERKRKKLKKSPTNSVESNDQKRGLLLLD